MSIATMRKALTGVSGVPVTAYDGKGEVEPRITAKVYERVAAAGIHNIVAAGNTGEFYALTPQEIRIVHEAAVSGVAGKAPVTAAIGRSLREAIGMAKDAAAIGASAVMSHQPVDPFAAPAAQIDYFCNLADASSLPLIAYVRADGFAVADIVRLANHGNIAGIKFATTDLMLLSRAIPAASPGGALFVCGLAESWAPTFTAAGARGFTSGLVNVAPKLSLGVHAALEKGDFAAARAIVNKLEPFERMRTKFRNGANVTVVKEAVTYTGLDVGPVRVPGLPELDQHDREELYRLLQGWDAEGDIQTHSGQPAVKAAG
ncbi:MULTISPECIES: dihydrodipicolinate synthase family protein [Rhizobium]|uniref:Dihydrodipicolinate synthase family protein n=1 Tax=Rhizobium leguminosarum bv. viciae TaxID=387 RepID=A0A8G2MS78_RHILV|nr:dihydrodipicolinate synthase family protein [Rhizobium leguminosarum]MBY5425112.1 dihydrodipicolinate synthase family protein [Rhizobium leguminosarum]NKK05470.1 dihydrodipicolinate synthase family protein [Rhizobium leguminosarum bv. viciae]NKK19640.1 dihydrodipicolinate synthase family protein [Rhizobium leguminosarum bv. viciae]TBX96845.1 dihydrodipicolinate synthase family protein [Rhizobium leguminosarum bv. viciae]TBZ23717.1 dihydrodipicolinate synthase family protein [Rhizobium legum